MLPRIEQHNGSRGCTAGDCRNKAVAEIVFDSMRVEDQWASVEYLCVECLKELQRQLDPLFLLVKIGINTKRS